MYRLGENAFADTVPVWAATTKDKDYIQMVGMKHVVSNPEHRKEFITGNLADFMTNGGLSSDLVVPEIH